MSLRPIVHADAEAGGRAVAERVFDLAAEAIRARGAFAIAVSGGRSPETMFRAFASRRAAAAEGEPWTVLWCDERVVPPDDPRSNFGLARRLWLAPARVPAERIIPVPTELPAEQAADRYDGLLRERFAPGASSPRPRQAFDVAVLGLGPDGHTASLFPGRPSLAVVGRWSVAERSPTQEPRVPRVTLTLEGIGHVRHAIFLAWGAEKRPVLSSLFSDDGTTGARDLPAGRVRAQESVEWHVDRSAWPTGPSA